MDPYAKPDERRIGDHKPRLRHVAPDLAKESSPRERQVEKDRVAAARRSIKKAARRDLKKQLARELDAVDEAAVVQD